MPRRMNLSFYPPALLAGSATGVALILLSLFLDVVVPPSNLALGTILVRSVMIYSIMGFVTGVVVRREENRSLGRGRFAPGTVHALIVGLVLAFFHTLVLLIAQGGRSPREDLFLIELLLVGTLSAVGGNLGAFFFNRNR